jgi:hypothetical protein
MHALKPGTALLPVMLFSALISCTSLAEDSVPIQWQRNEAGLQYRNSWIGNTWGGGPRWFQQNVADIFVAPDGRVYTNSGWDEAGRDAGVYGPDGEPLSIVPVRYFGQQGSRAITANDRYVFVACHGHRGRPGRGPAVGRFHRDRLMPHRIHDQIALNVPASTRSGRQEVHDGYPGAFVTLGSYDDRGQEHEGRAPTQVWGLAIIGDELFVAEDLSHTVHVLDVESLQVKRRFELRWPSKLCGDRAGYLWAIQRPDDATRHPLFRFEDQGPHRIVQIDPKSGAETGKVITNVELPTELAIDNQGRLMVAESGPEAQVLYYDITGDHPRLVETFGVEQGYLAEPVPGRVTGQRLMPTIQGLGTDRKGNLYIAERPAAGSTLRCYSPDGELKWFRYTGDFMRGSGFVPGTDGRGVYTPTYHYQLDYSRAPGQEATIRGKTIDPYGQPEDVREQTPMVRILDGRTYVFYHGYHSYEMPINMVLPGTEVQKPVAHIVCNYNGWTKGRLLLNDIADGPNTAYQWRDLNGDGRHQQEEFSPIAGANDTGIFAAWVDHDGGLWFHQNRSPDMGIIYLPLTGFDEHHNPIYRWNERRQWPRPDPFVPGVLHYNRTIKHVQYDAREDVLYVAGWTKLTPADPQANQKGKGMGEIVRYDGWLRGDGDVSPTWRTVMPGAEQGLNNGLSKPFCSDDFVFIGTLQDPRGRIYVYDAKMGESLGAMDPDANVHGDWSHNIGWIDIPYALDAVKRDDGITVLMREDNAKTKQLIYYVAPPGHPVPMKKQKLDQYVPLLEPAMRSTEPQ